jgi:hypothetical protein
MYANGVHDTITDPFFYPLDLNGNGITGALDEPVTGIPTDRELYFRLSLFFSESYGFTGAKHGFCPTGRPRTVEGRSSTLIIKSVRTIRAKMATSISSWPTGVGMGLTNVGTVRRAGLLGCQVSTVAA